MRPFLTSRNDLDAVEFGDRTGWDVKFVGAPHPFDNWMPVVQLEEDIFRINTESVSIAMDGSEITVPKSGTKSYDIMLHMLDTTDLVLFDWYLDWYAEIYGVPREAINAHDGLGFQYQFQVTGVRPIDEICRTLYIAKVDRQGNQFRQTEYMVYPRSELKYEGTNSASDQIVITMGFVVISAVSANIKVMNQAMNNAADYVTGGLSSLGGFRL